MVDLLDAIGLGWDPVALDLKLTTNNTRLEQAAGLAAYEQALAIRSRELFFAYGLLLATDRQWSERLPQLMRELESSETWVELNGLTIRRDLSGLVQITAKVQGVQGPGVSAVLNLGG